MKIIVLLLSLLIGLPALAEVNIIFTFNPVRAIRDAEHKQLFEERFSFVDDIPEMRRVAGAIPLQATVPSLQGMQRVKTLLDSLDSRGAIQIIGVWRSAVDADGNEFMEKHPNFTFDFALYKLHLRNVATFDINGVQIGSRRPTDLEAHTTHVNKFAGMPDRDIL